MNTQLTHKGMLWSGILCIFLSFIFFNSHSRTSTGFSLIGSKKESKVRFKLINNLIVVPIRLNNGRVTRAVVDTGIRSVVLYGRKYRRDLDFTNTRNIKINGLGKGKRQEGQLTVNNVLQIGDVLGEGVGIVSIDKEIPFEILRKHGVEAILGYQLFSNFIIEIDYLNSEITFRDPRYFSPNDEAYHLDLELIDTKPYITTTLKIKNEHSVLHAKEMKLLLDTGAALDMLIYNNSKNAKLFTLNSSKKMAIGQGMNGEIGGYTARSINMDIGNIELTDIVVSLVDRKSGKKHSKHFGVDGLIGGNVLKKYKVTFDYINGDVYLEKPDFWKYSGN